MAHRLSRPFLQLLSCGGAMLLAGCATSGQAGLAAAGPEADHAPHALPSPDTVDGDADAPAMHAAATAAQTGDLAAFFQAYEDAGLATSPETKAYRGIRDGDYGKWDSYTLASAERDDARTETFAAMIEKGWGDASLAGQDALSVRLFELMAQRRARLSPYRDHDYIFEQMHGRQSSIPSFLINIHRVANRAEAEAYISRIGGIGRVMDELIARSRAQADGGIMPPDWVYPHVLSDIDNLLTPTAPDYSGNAIIDDFRQKVAALDLPEDDRRILIAKAVAAWEQGGLPAYRALKTEMLRQQPLAGKDDGVWRLPDGDAYYTALLSNYTTTDLSAQQIHDLGLREVDRIHAEMREIQRKVGFEGTLGEFFDYTRTDPRFFAKSREEYLGKVDTALAAMEAKLPEWFVTLPADKLEVKPVEAFREKSAGKAFYSRPAPDGSRPGIYYVNLYRLEAMSLNELEALAYHEGLPGHHLQLSVQTGLDDLPPFRRFGSVTAFSEGWGLYSEKLAKDMGFYTDPYSDFGRLGMELWRASRLVVDTGIHSKRWSRQQAIDYLIENTPNPEADVAKAIERYIVYPGQATAYMIGKLKIEEARDRARSELGEDFDIRAFHQVVLENGPVPMQVLDDNVDAWVAEVKGQTINR